MPFASPNVTAVRMTAAQMGGCKTYHRVSTADNNAASIKVGAGTIYGWSIGSQSGNIRYVKLYDKASSPSVGTDTPLHTIIVPGNASGAGTNFMFAPGLICTNGIALAAVANPADSDNTAIGVNDLVIGIFYQ